MYRTLITFVVFIALAGCTSTRDKVQAKKAQWEQALSTLPLGSFEDDVKRWGEQNKVVFQFLSAKKQYYAIAENVPVEGIPFPCDRWMIVVKISLNNERRVESSEVSTIGSCI